jgi:G3E family GTPase
MAKSGAPIPFTVIGGFLGAGKTTLLNRILRENEGRRYAVLVNDFGALNIDADLVVAHGGDTIALANGCICCSIGDSLADTLIDLLRRPDPADHIVVEASGVANPARIADVAVLDPDLSPDGVIVLADAERIAAQLDDRLIGETVRQQLKAADLIVLNKRDLVGAPVLAAAERAIAGEAPGVPVLPAADADVPPGFLTQRPPPADGAVRVHGDDPGHADFRQAVVDTGPLPDRNALEAALDRLPASVLRGKGFVRFADAPADAYVLHLAGRRHSLEHAPGAAAPGAACRIVFIGVPGMPSAPELAALIAGENAATTCA